MRRLLLLVVLTACQKPTPPVSAEPLFEVGGANDPVVRMALSVVNSTVVYTFTNLSLTQSTSPGLLIIGDLFDVGSAPSAAVSSYLQSGDAIALAGALGLTLSSDAFYVEALAPGQSVSVAMSIGHNARVSLIARIAGSTTDFFGLDRIKLSAAPVVGRYAVSNGRIASRLNLLGLSASVSDQSACTSTLDSSTTLLNVAFTASAWDHAWPFTIGFDGDFNGDWYTDGVTARMIDVNAKLPTITGFAKFFYLCPAAGAKLSAFSEVATLYKQPQSDTTMVVYFFDENSNYISHAENWPLHAHNYRTHALYDAVIPAGTRQIAVVPMGYFASGETDSSHYYNLTVAYEPANAFTTTVLASDDFSSYGAGDQPTGWTDAIGDWYVVPAHNHVTAWNPSWQPGTGSLPLDSQTKKTFALGSVTATTKLSVRAFAASTFTDPASYVQLRALYDTGQEVTASVLAGSAWGDLDIRRAAIPLGATSVTVTLQMYLGPNETSAAYLDNLSLWKVQ